MSEALVQREVGAILVQVIVQAYASANAATYDDYIWAKYRMGDAFNVKDPGTGQPATRYRDAVAA